MDVFQLLVSGISQGCVYGLIALGFVLIEKNFACLVPREGEDESEYVFTPVGSKGSGTIRKRTYGIWSIREL